jgi:ethanolamine utilization microcompartment shell protein EutS
MGVPTQGTGPTTAWVGDGSGYDAAPYNLPNDGAQWSFATVMVLLARIINSIQALYTGVPIQVAAYTGAIWTIAAGPLSAFLHDLADKAAKVDAAINTFTGAVSIEGTTQVTGLTATGTVEMQGNLIADNGIKLPVGAVVTRAATAVSASATTLTMDAAVSAEYVAEAWNGSGGALAVTLAAYVDPGGRPNPEMTLKFGPTKPSHRANFNSPACTLTGLGTITFRWSGAWHVRAGGGNNFQLLNP